MAATQMCMKCLVDQEPTRCSWGGLFNPFLGPGCAGFVCASAM